MSSAQSFFLPVSFSSEQKHLTPKGFSAQASGAIVSLTSPYNNNLHGAASSALSVKNAYIPMASRAWGNTAPAFTSAVMNPNAANAGVIAVSNPNPDASRQKDKPKKEKLQANQKEEKHFSWKNFLFNTASVILGGGLLVGIPAFLFRKRLATMWEQVRGVFSLPAPWVSAFRLARERKWPEMMQAIRRGQEEFFYDSSDASAKAGPHSAEEAQVREGLNDLKALREKSQSLLKFADTLGKLQDQGLEENLIKLNRNIAQFNAMFSELKKPERLKALNQFLANLPSGSEIREIVSTSRQVSRALPGSWVGYFMGLKPTRRY